jgi:hypothetical protein
MRSSWERPRASSVRLVAGKTLTAATLEEQQHADFANRSVQGADAHHVSMNTHKAIPHVKQDQACTHTLLHKHARNNHTPA